MMREESILEPSGVGNGCRSITVILVLGLDEGRVELWSERDRAVLTMRIRGLVYPAIVEWERERP